LGTNPGPTLTDNNISSPLNFFANIKGFKMACINVNRLMKHSDGIRFILTSTTLEVLAINESKLDNSINDGEIHIPGYVSIRKDRTRHGGGVLIYIKENLAYSNRSDLVPYRLEMICLEIKLFIIDLSWWVRGIDHHVLVLIYLMTMRNTIMKINN
jgi:hypothetical protein